MSITTQKSAPLKKGDVVKARLVTPLPFHGIEAGTIVEATFQHNDVDHNATSAPGVQAAWFLIPVTTLLCGNPIAGTAWVNNYEHLELL